jgi:hypothetical protein
MALISTTTTAATQEVTENLIKSLQKFVLEAQSVWVESELQLKKSKDSLQKQDINLKRKFRYCELGKEIIELRQLATQLFQRSYTQASEETQLAIERALLNNYSHVLVNNIAEKITADFDWNNAKVTPITFGRGANRLSGYEVKVVALSDSGQFSENKPPSIQVAFEILENSKAKDDYFIVDLILVGFRVSQFYAKVAQDVQRGRTRLEDVLIDWEKQHSPHCP